MATFATVQVEASTPAAAPGCAAVSTVTATNSSAAPIPDNGTLVRTITVVGAQPFIWDLDVFLAVTHTAGTDLDITLTSPAGTVVTLTTDNGGSNDNVFNGTLFDDQAATPITDTTFTNGVAVVTAAPEQPLARFYGENPNGVWTLLVTDDAAGNIGAFSRVDLKLTAVPVLPNDVVRSVTVTPGLSIPDNSFVLSSQVVRGGGSTVTGLRLRTFITHTFPGDLNVTLTSPSGTVVTVTSRNGGGSDNVFNGTVWDDRTGTAVTDFTYANAVTATPLSPEEAFASFIGEAGNGTWTLRVADEGSLDVGTLSSWTLEVFTGSCAQIPAAPPGFAPPVTTTFTNNTPMPIPATGTSGTITSTRVVSGAGPHLWDLDVVTSIRHTFSSDLDITLTSPAGTVVTLTTDNGGAADDVFNGTRWDDQADVPVTDALYVNNVPRAALVPEGALGAFVGENPNGTWTLTIVDDAGGDTGMLDAWSLRVSTITGAPGVNVLPLLDTTSVGIPDNSQSGLLRTRTVAGLGSFLTGVRLVTNILHPAPGELEMFLTSPSGTTVTITTSNGDGFANVFNGTTWEDRPGRPPVTDATYAANVVQTSLVPEEAMSAFVGENPNGTWTLTVLDTVAGQTGTLSRWTLVLETGTTWNVTQSLSATPAGVLPGGSITYTAAIASTGPGDAQGPLTFTLPLPASTTFSSLASPAGWSCTTPAVGAGGTISCTRAAATLAVGATQTFTVVTAVAAATPLLTQLTATASVQGGAGELGMADNTATATTLVVQPTALDTDGDSLPNAWETTFGLDPSSPGGADGPFGDPDGDGRTNAQELAEGTHPRGFHTRYFAEGATSAFFDVSIALLNTSGENAHTLLRFLRAGGTPVGHTLLIGPTSRATVNPKTIAGMATAEFSTVLESDQPLVADRTMTWDAQRYGSHAESSVAAPALQWYLAEGATHSGFQLFYLLQNANSTAAIVNVEYLLPAGAPVTRAYVVAPNSRATVWVNADPALASTEVSATFTSDQPIIVERAMYLNRPGQTFAAGHGSAAVTAPSTQWFLAEGATGPFFDLFVLVANPTQTTANITATFLLPNGTTVLRNYAISPKARFNIWVDQEGPELANTAVSTTITSDVPVLVERAMWWPGDGNSWYEAHNSFGATSTGIKWALADGEQGGPFGVETYVLVANTSTFDGLARVTLLKEDGTSLVKTFPIRANSRLNVPIGAAEIDGGFGTAINGLRFGCVVESLVPTGGTDPAQIVVERAMYSNSGGVVWAAGTNALATKLF